MRTKSDIIQDMRYYVGNPSAWESYDDKMSERLRGWIAELEKPEPFPTYNVDWYELKARSKLSMLECGLRDLLGASADPESGHVEWKPKWWDDFWSGIFLGAKFNESLIYEQQREDSELVAKEKK